MAYFKELSQHFSGVLTGKHDKDHLHKLFSVIAVGRKNSRTACSEVSHFAYSLLQENEVTKPCELFRKVGKYTEKYILKLSTAK
jgi:hypothetical protein